MTTTLSFKTIQAYNIRLKKLGIKNYDNYREIELALSSVANLETRKQSCCAVIYHIRQSKGNESIITEIKNYMKNIRYNIDNVKKRTK